MPPYAFQQVFVGKRLCKQAVQRKRRIVLPVKEQALRRLSIGIAVDREGNVYNAEAEES